MTKKRILLLITRSEPGGAQSHVLELLQGLKKKYEVILATGEQGFLLDEAKVLGIEAFLLPSLKRNISPVNDIKAYKEIRDTLLQTRPDLVHTHSSKAGILGRLAAHRLGIKNIFTAHGWAFADGTPWPRKLIVTKSLQFPMQTNNLRFVTTSRIKIKFQLYTMESLTLKRAYWQVM
jgi:glycosyltransferase involved in cell wall biosynthesis